MFGKLIGAMVTPFNNDDEIDYEVVLELLKRYEDSGHSAIVICGSTGESTSLTIGEKIDLLEFCLQHSDLKIIMGICENDTKKAISEIELFAPYRPHGFLLVVPYYNKPPQRGIFLHFKKCALAANHIPIIVYNVPSRTCSHIELVTLKKLMKVNKNIVGIKEATNDFSFMASIKKALPKCLVYYGNDKDFLKALQSGADGIISVSSIIYGEEYKLLITDYDDGFINRLLADYLSFIGGLISLESNPIPIKYLLKKNGVGSMNLRLPLVELSGDNQRVMDILA